MACHGQIHMYVIMPLKVCPHCVYHGINGALCTSGLNVISRRIAGQGNLRDFHRRGEGLFCHNHLYMGALFIPIVATIPALFWRMWFHISGPVGSQL